MKAIVNGKQIELTVKKKYHNGSEMVYECVTKDDGIWVAVPESMVIANVRTRIEYSGSRKVEGASCRTVLVTLTAKEEAQAEIAHERLIKLASEYNAALCSNVESNGDGTYSITEEFEIEDKEDFENFKKNVYKKIK